MHKLPTFLLLGSLLFSCATSSTSDNTDSFGEEIEDDGGEFIAYNNDPAEGFNLEGSDMLAMLLADKCMLAMGGREAWDNTRFISWNFFGRRNHLWDKATGDVRIEDTSNEITILMNIQSMEGSVYRGGMEMTDSVDHFLRKGYGWWVNDSYWLVMPFKLKDSGVTLRYLGEGETESGKPADVVQLTFEDIGLTPENIYEVWIDTDSKLVSQWAYYPDSSASEPRFVTPWDNYQEYGEILLSGNRGDYSLGNIAVFTEVPGEIFKNHNMLIASLK